MNIEKLELCNFRGFKKLSFQFSKKLNLFVGVNGSGKSTVLDGLAITLSWLISRIQRENGKGRSIKDSDIQNGQPGAFLDLGIHAGKVSYRWILTRSNKRSSFDFKSQLGGASKLADCLRKEFEEKSSFPVIAYYPVDRVVKNITKSFFIESSIDELDVYENALDGKANFHSFFDWFHVQDNILNEQAVSRTKWMIQKRSWIKKRVNKILSLLEVSFPSKIENDYDNEFNYLLRRFRKDEMVFEEPRFLFRELAELIHMIERRSYKELKSEQIFHDLEYMFHKMGSLSSEYKDNLIKSGGIHEKIIRQISQGFTRTDKIQTPDKMVDLLWECFSFATSLSLWWLNDESRRKVERLFRACYPLRRNTKQTLPSQLDSLPSSLNHIIEKDIRLKKYVNRSEGKTLQTVRDAIEAFIPEYKNIEVKRVPSPHMVLDKNGHSLSLNQLSDGEKNLIALVGDIARRLEMANPSKENPLKGKGVIMIDEIDLHLHPSWQRMIIPKLLEVFPNCQFFISTHSPQVISNIKPEEIFLLNQTGQEIVFDKPEESYGMSIDRVVELVMDDHSRPDESREKLDRLFELIERSKLNEANKLLSEMKEYMQTDPDLMRAEMLIRREEMRG